MFAWIPWNLSFRYTHCTGQFTPKMKVNAEPQLLSSLVRIDSGVVAWKHRLESFFHEMKCNGMTGFMEFLLSLHLPLSPFLSPRMAIAGLLQPAPWFPPTVSFSTHQYLWCVRRPLEPQFELNLHKLVLVFSATKSSCREDRSSGPTAHSNYIVRA